MSDALDGLAQPQDRRAGLHRALLALVDLGSTAAKASLRRFGGETVAERSRPVATRDGERIEHDASELATAVEELLDELRDERRPAAIGLTCQRSTCLLWERDGGRPLTPAVSWQDRSQIDRVEALGSHREEIARRTGLPLSPHYAASKLAALLDELPDGRERAAAGEIVAGTLDAFLVRRLTGRDGTEPGHAGRTLLYDLESGDWSPELCDLFGVPAAALPPLRQSVGGWGDHRGVPLTAVAGDQQAALVGHGGWAGEVTAAHFGTGAFVLTAAGERPLRAEGLLSAVLASTPGGRRFQLEGSVNSAGSAADWACRLTGERLEEWAERPLDPDALPRVLPALAGLAAPWWRPEARAVIAGLDRGSGGAELLGGVLAGVAMRVLDCAEALAAAAGPSSVLRVSGKLTRLNGLVGLLADAGQLPVEVADDEETGLAGIGRLAALGAGAGPELLDAPPAVRLRREPEWTADRAAATREGWRAFVRRALEL